MEIYERYGFDGLKDGGTFPLDATTATAIKDNPTQIEGKVVALVDGYTVGYGSDGDAILGVVEKVEHEQGRSEQLCVSVLWQRSFENIPFTGTVSAKDNLVVDGAGNVKTGTAFSGAVVWGADTTKNTCTIRVF